MKFKAHKRWLTSLGGYVIGYQAVFIKENGSQLMSLDGRTPIAVSLDAEKLPGGYDDNRIRRSLIIRMRAAIEKVSEEHGTRKETQLRPEDERR